MTKPLLALALAASLQACVSIESTPLAPEVAVPGGQAVALVQVNTLGLTALFHLIDIVGSDLDQVVNKLLVGEAKAMGGLKVELKSAHTTPRHGFFYSLVGGLIGVTSSEATGIVVGPP